MEGSGHTPVRHRLWVVDDVELERDAARRVLEHLYDVDTFSDGAAVLERIASGAELPSVLILDWHMQGVGGIEVVRFLRADERTVGVPILVFTATGDAQDLLEALSSGADDYVGKGSPAGELHARVGALVRSKTLRDRAERAERELEVLLRLEREARAEAEGANRAKDDFLATVSHELRTPLTAILGWVRILKNTPNQRDTLDRAIETIERNAVAQARLVDDLLDVSRIVSGKLRLESSRVDLTDAVEQALETVRPSAAAKGLTIASELAPASVSGDPARLQQIAWNLLSNAIKFTPEGGRVDVRITTDGREVVLRVEDTGQGIASELLPHVFDRFRQADSTTARPHGGLGLGLAIVRQLVLVHAGRVNVHSRGVGQGTTFEVALPALPAQPLPPEPATVKEMPDLAGVSLLVVDDDTDTRDVLATLLTSVGAEVLDAESASQALAMLDARRPDAILSDLAMPGQDGFHLIREVRRSEDGERRRIPAIAISAHAREEDRARALRSGFQEYLAKPIDPGALIEAVARICGVVLSPPVEAA